jgi:hypothetical protein
MRLKQRALTSIFVLQACAAPAGDSAAGLSVSCGRPSPADTVSVHVVLEPEAQESGGRILVRVDSLQSDAGIRFDSETGFLVETFVTRGPAHGCASRIHGGARVWAPGPALSRSWILVKSDDPVRIVLEKRDGTRIGSHAAFPGERVDPIVWSAR